METGRVFSVGFRVSRFLRYGFFIKIPPFEAHGFSFVSSGLENPSFFRGLHSGPLWGPPVISRGDLVRPF